MPSHNQPTTYTQCNKNQQGNKSAMLLSETTYVYKTRAARGDNNTRTTTGRAGSRSYQTPPPVQRCPLPGQFDYSSRCQISLPHVEYPPFTCHRVPVTGAATLWDPWDASPPTSENVKTKCIWSPPTFATGCHFRGGVYSASRKPSRN